MTLDSTTMVDLVGHHAWRKLERYPFAQRTKRRTKNTKIRLSYVYVSLCKS